MRSLSFLSVLIFHVSSVIRIYMCMRFGFVTCPTEFRKIYDAILRHDVMWPRVDRCHKTSNFVFYPLSAAKFIKHVEWIRMT
jgi:hypothetical protein